MSISAGKWNIASLRWAEAVVFNVMANYHNRQDEGPNGWPVG